MVNSVAFSIASQWMHHKDISGSASNIEYTNSIRIDYCIDNSYE